MATVIRLQLARSEQHARAAPGVQPADDHARHDDDLLRRRADPVRLRELSGPAHARRARHGVSAPQRVRLLALPLRRPAALLQLRRRRRPLWRGLGARRRLVRLRAAHRTGLLPRQQHRLLDPRHRRSPAIGTTGTAINLLATAASHALPGHDARPHAALRVADARVRGDVARRPAAAHGGAGHAAARSLPRRALLRHAGRRLGGAVAALLLDLRPSRGLHPRPAARSAVASGDHPGVLAQADLRLPDHGRRVGRDRLHQHLACGPTTCSPSA